MTEDKKEEVLEEKVEEKKEEVVVNGLDFHTKSKHKLTPVTSVYLESASHIEERQGPVKS